MNSLDYKIRRMLNQGKRIPCDTDSWRLFRADKQDYLILYVNGAAYDYRPKTEKQIAKAKTYPEYSHTHCEECFRRYKPKLYEKLMRMKHESA
jgi:hypothetical protein